MTDTTTTPTLDIKRLTTLTEAVRKANDEYRDACDGQREARRLYEEKVAARDAARSALYDFVGDLTGDAA